MKTAENVRTWIDKATDLSRRFEQRSAAHDRNGDFVSENYTELKAVEFFSALVPSEFGGGGVGHSELCDVIRHLAHGCGSTALAFSMHQHLVAAAVWRYKTRGESIPLLQKVAREQPVLISTGARDWLDSNGDVIKTEGGYLVSGRKSFASGSSIGDIAVTSAPYHHPTEGWQVLHFAVAMATAGVSLETDWDTLGMRGTGSQTIRFDHVFVPESAVTLTRPRNGYHPVWDVILAVALPMIMSAYVGIAEKALELVLQHVRKQPRDAGHLPLIIGKMNNSVVAARVQWREMVALCNDIDFKPGRELTVDMLSLKTNVVNSCIQSLQEGMQAIGGQSFYKTHPIERLFRDIQAARFHPLPEYEQYEFTGRRMMEK